MTPKTNYKPITSDFKRDRLVSLGSVLYNVVTIWRTGKIPIKKGLVCRPFQSFLSDV